MKLIEFPYGFRADISEFTQRMMFWEGNGIARGFKSWKEMQLADLTSQWELILTVDKYEIEYVEGQTGHVVEAIRLFKALPVEERSKINKMAHSVAKSILQVHGRF